MEQRRVLVICAHDDDEVIGPGGTIRKLADSGAAVTAMVCAVGNEGYDRLEDKDAIAARRRLERARAEGILGIRSGTALEYRDFDNLECEGVYREIMRAVRTARPQLVLTHLEADYLAHRTLARIAPEAVWQAGWSCSMELGEPWRVERLYHFPILSMVAQPSHIVDITDTLAAKLKAMEAYASQHAVVAGVLDMIEAKARAYGSLVGVRYGEPFVRSSYIPRLIRDPGALIDSLA